VAVGDITAFTSYFNAPTTIPTLALSSNAFTFDVTSSLSGQATMLYYNKNNLINAFKALDRTQFHD
jgi:hypothetical protein